MEVIREGNPDITKKQTADCQYCSAKLRITKGDVKRELRLGVPYGHPYFTCPECGHVVSLPDWE